MDCLIHSCFTSCMVQARTFAPMDFDWEFYTQRIRESYERYQATGKSYYHRLKGVTLTKLADNLPGRLTSCRTFGPPCSVIRSGSVVSFYRTTSSWLETTPLRHHSSNHTKSPTLTRKLTTQKPRRTGKTKLETGTPQFSYGSTLAVTCCQNPCKIEATFQDYVQPCPRPM